MKSWVQFLVRGAVCAVALVVGATSSFGATDISSSPSEEFRTETEALVAATAALFDSIEMSLKAPARPNASTRIQILGDAIPTSAVTANAAFDAFPPDRGPVNHLTGYRITWYPVDRLLGVVDFMGTYDGNRNLVCGFVTWDMTNPDTPRLEHLTATYVDIGLLAVRQPISMEETLFNANCAYGEIGPNFEALVTQK